MVMPIPYPTNVALTGRVRFRTNWQGKLIAQVEESYQLRHFFHTSPTEYARWRDAGIFDIQLLNPFDTARLKGGA